MVDGHIDIVVRIFRSDSLQQILADEVFIAGVEISFRFKADHLIDFVQIETMNCANAGVLFGQLSDGFPHRNCLCIG